MEHHDRGSIALAVSLSGVAGYVDGVGFLHLGGYFVSFMSGNSTRLGVALGGGEVGAVGTALLLVALFVGGVMLGTWVGQLAGSARRPAVLAFDAGLLTLAAGAGALGRPDLAVAAMVLAMGAENAVFHRNGDVAIGLTYMTGALVRMGQRLAAALTGGPRFAWAPYFLLWSGLCLGAAAGALAYQAAGLGALWGAAAASAGLTTAVVANRMRRSHAVEAA